MSKNGIETGFATVTGIVKLLRALLPKGKKSKITVENKKITIEWEEKQDENDDFIDRILKKRGLAIGENKVKQDKNKVVTNGKRNSEVENMVSTEGNGYKDYIIMSPNNPDRPKNARVNVLDYASKEKIGDRKFKVGGDFPDLITEYICENLANDLRLFVIEGNGKQVKLAFSKIHTKEEILDTVIEKLAPVF